MPVEKSVQPPAPNDMPKYCFLLVIFIGFWLVRCSDRHEAPVQTATVATADTVGVSALVDTAYMLLRDSQVERAMEQMKKVFEVCHRAGLTAKGQKVLRDLVLKSEKYHEPTPAYQLIDWAIQITENNVSTDTLAGKLYFLKGYLLHQDGKSSEARYCYGAALQKLPEHQFKYYHLILFGNISQIYNELGDYKKGEEYALQGLRFFEATLFDLPLMLAINEKRKALRTLGWALYEQNKNDEAIKKFRNALIITPNENKSDIYTFISKCHLNEHRYDSAFSNVLTALDCFRKFSPGNIDHKADALNQLARCQLEKGELLNALHSFREALPASEASYGPLHHDYYKIWVYIGNVNYRLHRPGEALVAYDRATYASLPESLPDRIRRNPTKECLQPDPWQMKAFEGKSQVYYDCFRTGLLQSDTARVLALSNLDLFLSVKELLFSTFESDTSKLDIQSSYSHWYEKGIELALSATDTSKAIGYILASKASLLKEQQNKSANLNSMPDSLKITYRLLKKQIVEAEGAVQRNEYVSQPYLLDLRLRMDKLESQVKLFTKSEKTDHRIQADSLQRILPVETAILDFFYGDSAIYMLALTQTERQVFKVKNTASLKQDIYNLTSTVDINSGDNTPRFFSTAALSLYRSLLETPLHRLKYIKRLWIVPDGPLHYLPFSALLTTETNSWSGSAMPFLLKKYAIGYAYTPEQFIQKKDAPAGLKTYGGWGITYDSLTLSTISHSGKLFALNTRDFGPLPKAPEEITVSARNFKGNTWIDQNASRESFIRNASSFRICHLAMHAIADDQSPEKTKLIFFADTSAAKTNSHFLYASSIYGLNIPADLIVLSACNTATGELQHGEGITSLGRAFQFAGAHSVLMTQWSISDNAAAGILPDFFNFLRQGLPKDIALQKAQLTMLERSPLQTPADWAGFIISGNIDPLAIGTSDDKIVWWLVLSIFVLSSVFYIKKRYMN